MRDPPKICRGCSDDLYIPTFGLIPLETVFLWKLGSRRGSRFRRLCVTLTEKISQELETLPEIAQREVLDFVEFLKWRNGDREGAEWSRFSLRQAMNGLETEPDLYTENDVRRRPG